MRVVILTVILFFSIKSLAMIYYKPLNELESQLSHFNKIFNDFDTQVLDVFFSYLIENGQEIATKISKNKKPDQNNCDELGKITECYNEFISRNNILILNQKITNYFNLKDIEIFCKKVLEIFSQEKLIKKHISEIKIKNNPVKMFRKFITKHYEGVNKNYGGIISQLKYDIYSNFAIEIVNNSYKKSEDLSWLLKELGRVRSTIARGSKEENKFGYLFKAPKHLSENLCDVDGVNMFPHWQKKIKENILQIFDDILKCHNGEMQSLSKIGCFTCVVSGISCDLVTNLDDNQRVKNSCIIDSKTGEYYICDGRFYYKNNFFLIKGDDPELGWYRGAIDGEHVINKYSISNRCLQLYLTHNKVSAAKSFKIRNLFRKFMNKKEFLNDQEKFVNKLSSLLLYLSHSSTFKRGQASITKWILKGTAKYHGYNISWNDWVEESGMEPDMSALNSLSEQGFQKIFSRNIKIWSCP